MYIDEFVEDLSNCIGFISGDELIFKKMRYDFEYEIRTRNHDKKLGSIKWDTDNECIVLLLNNKSYTFDRYELTIEKTKEIGKMINKAFYNMNEAYNGDITTATYKFDIEWNTGDEYWDNFPDYDEFEGTIEGLNEYLNSQLSEEDPPANFDKEALRSLLDGKTVYDETGARYSVKLSDTIEEAMNIKEAITELEEHGYILERYDLDYDSVNSSFDEEVRLEKFGEYLYNVRELLVRKGFSRGKQADNYDELHDIAHRCCRLGKSIEDCAKEIILTIK